MTETNEKCVFCDQPLTSERTQKLTETGVEKILKVCNRLKVEKKVSCGQRIHAVCRRKFVDERIVSRLEKQLKANAPLSPKKTRSTTSTFNFKDNCFLCGSIVSPSDQKQKWSRVLTSEKHFDQKIKAICKERNDRWSTEVVGRLSTISDLFAADAVYHKICDSNFRTGKTLPAPYVETFNPVSSDKLQNPQAGRTKSATVGKPQHCPAKSADKGRPVDCIKLEAFLEILQYCENLCDEKSCCTVSELQEEMRRMLSGKKIEPYSIKYIKKKLVQHFKDEIIITESQGLKNVIFLRQRADSILHQFYSKNKTNEGEDDAIRLLKAAGKLIRSACKQINHSTEFYPSVSDVKNVESCSDAIPQYLSVFLNALAPDEQNKLKKVSIGHAIIQMLRPRGLLLPLQVSLGVQLHHLFASKQLIDILHKMGFCVSYNEILKYERNAAAMSSDHLDQLNPNQFTQFIADNVDHNLKTIDGHNTFHGMGMMAVITPALDTSKLVPRKNESSETIRLSGKIDVSFYNGGEKKIKKTFLRLKEIEAKDKFANLDLLWKISWVLSPNASNWSGSMQSSTSAPFPGKSNFLFFPMIDLNPSDYSCVYSTLLFIEAESNKFKVNPVLTFDQPLYYKAQTIIDNEPSDSPLKRIVLRLGGFHTTMSYLGCIGYFMESSGVNEILAEIYGSNTINQMLNGHDVSRAIRGFMLLDAALNYVLIREAFESPLKNDQNDDDFILNLNDQTLQDVTSLLTGLSEKTLTAEEICNSEVWRDIEMKLNNVKKSIISSSQNAKLWCQFMDMMDLLRAFLRAERTGDWNLHLRTLHLMLPYFAAAGHFLYCKSIRIYLQDMYELEQSHPSIHEKFMAGFHVGRRSDRFWGGLSTDLLIEQILMRSIKSSGGLTRGAGFSESRRSTWLLGMPACADVNAAMLSLLHLDRNDFESHKDCTSMRQKRDANDVRKIIRLIQHLSPFQPGESLKNLATGKVASASVNVHKAREIGEEILRSMDNKKVADFSFKKSSTVKTMKEQKLLKIDGEFIQVDPHLLFQRLLCILSNAPNNLPEFFKYELCTYPLALCDTSGFLRSPQKSDFTKRLLQFIPTESYSASTPDSNISYVIDGGHLLHLIPWPRHGTYREVMNQYSSFVLKHFGKATIVFDGYSNKYTIKDLTHLKRSKGKVGPMIEFENDMPLTLPKNIFLSNEKNKQKFLIALATHLMQIGCIAIHAPDDADMYIVLEALKQAEQTPTAIVGKDTDLLAISLHYFDASIHKNVYICDDNIPAALRKSSKLLNIKFIKTHLSDEFCKNVLFCHAFLGCDTTSHIHGINKGKIVSLLMKDHGANDDASVFCDQSSSKKAVENAGERLLVRLYGGKSTESLDALRFALFSQKMATSTHHVKPEVLPPTSDAAKFHSHRVFLQVMTWMGHEFEPETLGWRKGDSGLVPILMEKPPAPDSLLSVIRCSCAENGCHSQKCTCKKHGIKCSFACKNCQGVTCSNSNANSEAIPEHDESTLEDENGEVGGFSHFEDDYE